jgi:PKD repeat protein
MKNTLLLSCLIVIGLSTFSSCKKSTFACFDTLTDKNDIHVNVPVTFVATCSNNADSYFWEFGGNEDSTDYGYSVTRTFYTTGNVEVKLFVTGGVTIGAITNTYDIKP